MKKILFFSTLFTVFVMVLISCNQPASKETAQNDNVRHYRHIQFSETPWDAIKGTHPLTAEEAKVINNYKFTYDDQDRLVSVAYCRGEEVLGYGDLDAARVEITYEGNNETHLYFDEKGQPAEIQGSVFKSVYLLDDNGMRIGLKFYDKDGNPVENRNKISSYTWSKLPDGMVRENRYNLMGLEVILNEFCPFYELRFTYDGNGFVTRMANYEADTLYNCTAENCGDIGVSYFTFNNNDKGDLEQFTVYNMTGQMSNLYWGWAKFVNKVDENGYVMETAYFDQDDEYLGGKSTPVRQYLYDEHGAVVEVKMMDQDRNIINHPTNGVATIKYNYDKLGHPTDTLRYDKDLAAI